MVRVIMAVLLSESAICLVDAIYDFSTNHANPKVEIGLLGILLVNVWILAFFMKKKLDK